MNTLNTNAQTGCADATAERVVKPEKPVTKPAAKRPARRRWLKRFAVAVSVTITLAVTANWLWLMSGSGKWVLKIDRNGTQVYTMKTPGSAALKVRVVSRSREFGLGAFIAPVLDERIQQDCAKWVKGCLGYRIVQPWEARSQSNVAMWTIPLFAPFAPRELLIQNQVSQDPRTKAVTLESLAIPNRLPPNSCCVRVEHLHNIWRYTPLPDGSIQQEVLYDLDMGGAFPQLLLNVGAPEQLFEEVTQGNPAKLRAGGYRNTHLDFIDERGVAAR